MTEIKKQKNSTPIEILNRLKNSLKIENEEKAHKKTKNRTSIENQDGLKVLQKIENKRNEFQTDF